MEVNTITQGDALKTLRSLGTNSVDLVWTDPPYNVGKDYGTYKDDRSDDDYLKWIAEIIAELKRVSGNRIVMMIPHKYYSVFWQMLGSDYQQIILSYSPEGAIRYGFVNQYTGLLTNVRPFERCKNVWHNCQLPGLGYFFREQAYDHPGYTSEDVTGRVIRYFSRTGDLILDPFMGTGTTAKMAQQLNRRFLGVELNPEYIQIAEQRLRQKTLFAA